MKYKVQIFILLCKDQLFRAGRGYSNSSNDVSSEFIAGVSIFEITFISFASNACRTSDAVDSQSFIFIQSLIRYFEPPGNGGLDRCRL